MQIFLTPCECGLLMRGDLKHQSKFIEYYIAFKRHRLVETAFCFSMECRELEAAFESIKTMENPAWMTIYFSVENED